MPYTYELTTEKIKLSDYYEIYGITLANKIVCKGIADTETAINNTLSYCASESLTVIHWRKFLFWKYVKDIYRIQLETYINSIGFDEIPYITDLRTGKTHKFNWR